MTKNHTVTFILVAILCCGSEFLRASDRDNDFFSSNTYAVNDGDFVFVDDYFNPKPKNRNEERNNPVENRNIIQPQKDPLSRAGTYLQEKFEYLLKEKRVFTQEKCPEITDLLSELVCMEDVEYKQQKLLVTKQIHFYLQKNSMLLKNEDALYLKGISEMFIREYLENLNTDINEDLVEKIDNIVLFSRSYFPTDLNLKAFNLYKEMYEAFFKSKENKKNIFTHGKEGINFQIETEQRKLKEELKKLQEAKDMIENSKDDIKEGMERKEEKGKLKILKNSILTVEEDIARLKKIGTKNLKESVDILKEKPAFKNYSMIDLIISIYSLCDGFTPGVDETFDFNLENPVDENIKNEISQNNEIFMNKDFSNEIFENIKPVKLIKNNKLDNAFEIINISFSKLKKISENKKKVDLFDENCCNEMLELIDSLIKTNKKKHGQQKLHVAESILDYLSNHRDNLYEEQAEYLQNSAQKLIESGLNYLESTTEIKTSEKIKLLQTFSKTFLPVSFNLKIFKLYRVFMENKALYSNETVVESLYSYLDELEETGIKALSGSLEILKTKEDLQVFSTIDLLEGVYSIFSNN